MKVSRQCAVVAVALALLAWASGATAQEHKVEISGNAGYVLSDGVTFNGVLVNGNIYDTVDPKDSFGFNFTLGFFVNENFEIEFLYGRQQSTLQVAGTNTVDIADMGIDNYHGNFVFNFGTEDAKVRPYLFVGAGATRYGSIQAGALDIGGNTKFSGTAGGGLKLYFSEKAGLKLGVRWVPTYIKSDAAGWWCDPFYGCFLLSDDQYSNQFEFAGGLTFRF